MDHVQSSARLNDTVHVYRRTDHMWDWRLKDFEGRVLCTSGGQGYEHSTDALSMAWDLFPLIPADQFVNEEPDGPGDGRSEAQAKPKER